MLQCFNFDSIFWSSYHPSPIGVGKRGEGCGANYALFSKLKQKHGYAKEQVTPRGEFFQKPKSYHHNPLSTTPQQPKNCLSVSDHFVGLALKEGGAIGIMITIIGTSSDIYDVNLLLHPTEIGSYRFFKSCPAKFANFLGKGPAFQIYFTTVFSTRVFTKIKFSPIKSLILKIR